MEKTCIIGLGNQLGSKIVTVEDIAKHFNQTPEEIQEKSGITKLYLLDENEDMVDMTVECAKRVLLHTNIDINQIDGIFGSANPTMDTLIPTFTTQVAVRLGLKNVIADHIGLGCCGGLQALRNARNQLLADNKISYYLVVIADQTSRILDKEKFATSILFSEGCSVVLVTNNVTNHYDVFGIKTIHTKSLLTDQASVESIRLKNPYACPGTSPMIEMDGSAIYKFGTTILPHIFECAGVTDTEFKEANMYLVPHQPNLRMLQSLIKNYNLKEESIYIDGIKTIGNTSGPAVFFGLHDALSNGLLKNKVVLGAFGAELQVGGALLIAYGNPQHIVA